MCHQRLLLRFHNYFAAFPLKVQQKSYTFPQCGHVMTSHHQPLEIVVEELALDLRYRGLGQGSYKIDG
jgi:hypothetical protein